MTNMSNNYALTSTANNLHDLAQDLKDRNGSWDALRSDPEKYVQGIQMMFGKEVSVEEWLKIVNTAEEFENDEVEFKHLLESQTLSEPGRHLVLKPFPNNGYWSEYYRVLCQKYSVLSARATRDTCETIVSCLTLNENVPGEDRRPIKGAVFGSVQSGKTANMEGIIAMGADQGFNTFVILCGNITILKDQTVKRLNKDFSGRHLLKIIDVNTFKKGIDSISPDQKNVIVCLKTAGSLKKLHSIITRDEPTRRRLKVIVMDDEGDLATPDGSRSNATERATINRHVMSIVNCCPLNKPEDPYEKTYEAMNYIAYTATPFAILLNESGEKTLYPRDFIISIPPSNRYFGPCQIFGCNHASCSYPGMPIVNASYDIEERFRPFETEKTDDICDELLDAVCWFICCVAILRINKWDSPVSMLINTNCRVDQHRIVGQNLLDYINNHRDEMESRCETVFHEQTEAFDLEDLLEDYPDYYGQEQEEHIEAIIRYPRYDQIRETVHDILTVGAKQIPLVEGSPRFGPGIHICIQDSAYQELENGPTTPVYTRIIYPDPEKDECDVFAPAFLAIGGNALSRGFTLEGLVSTFFIRPTTQADTLMQMGRWFGYRDRYELLPRIWMSTACQEDFEFLSELDADLRDEINYHNRQKQSPSQFARRILAIPRAVGLKRHTSANKSKAMEYAHLSYTGKRQEFANFKIEPGLLDHNMATTLQFLHTIDKTDGVLKSSSKGLGWGNVVRWKNVPIDLVLDLFVGQFETGMDKSRDDCVLFKEWLDGIRNINKLDKWTVVVAGRDGGRQFKIDPDTSVGMVVRGKEKVSDPSLVKIKTLWSKADYFRDIFPEEIKDEGVVNRIRAGKFTGSIDELREEERKSADNYMPSLYIYCIDGKGKGSGKNKVDLDLEQDLVAFFVDVPHVSLPGDEDRVRIKLSPEA